jgi:hypothetical protein
MTLDGSAVCHSTRTGPNEPNDWELYLRTVRAGSRHCGEQYPAGLLSFVGWVDGSWVEGQAGVGQEPDDQVLVLADALDAARAGQGSRDPPLVPVAPMPIDPRRCCIWRLLKPASSTRVPERHRRGQD